MINSFKTRHVLYTLSFLWLSFPVASLAQLETLSRAKIKLCFTPGEDCTGMLVHEINQAKSSIAIQAYSFTSRPIANALIQAHKRGIKVELIVDRSQEKSQTHSAASGLKRQGIPVWVDYRPAIAHNKVMIIDQQVVTTGSFNFTKAAQQRNAENIIIIRDAQIANQYLANWQHRQQVSRVFKEEPEQTPNWLTQLLRWLEKILFRTLNQALRDAEF